MRKFIIKAAKPNDPFYMSEASEFLYFYCFGLKDLRKTLRCIMPRGYRTHTAQWYVNNMENNYIHIIHRWFQTTLYEIKMIERRIVPEKQLEYTNQSVGITHLLKLVNEKEWDSSLNNADNENQSH